MKDYFVIRVATHFFPKFFQVFLISSRFLKVHIFVSIFSLKLSLKLETVLTSIKTLKRWCRATLNMFLVKKVFDVTKKIYLYGRFFVSI